METAKFLSDLQRLALYYGRIGTTLSQRAGAAMIV
jgi:hypothetical protein